MKVKKKAVRAKEPETKQSEWIVTIDLAKGIVIMDDRAKESIMRMIVSDTIIAMDRDDYYDECYHKYSCIVTRQRLYQIVVDSFSDDDSIKLERMLRISALDRLADYYNGQRIEYIQAIEEMNQHG
jgi:phosphomevalonate kinase